MSLVDVFEPTRVCNSHGNSFPPFRSGIQNALDDLDARGGWVYMPMVNIEIDVRIDVDSPNHGVTLFSYGGEAQRDYGCVLTAANGLNDDMIKVDQATANHRNEFRDFAIDGNKANQAAGNGLHAEFSYQSIFRGLDIYECYDNGLWVEGQGGTNSSKNYVDKCRFAKCATGLRLTTTEENHISNNHFGSNTSRGCYPTSDLNILTNNVSLYDEIGFQIAGRYSHVIGTVIDKPDTYSIRFDATDRVIIDGLTIYDPSYSDDGVYSCILFDNQTHNRVIINDIQLLTPNTQCDYVIELGAGTVNYVSLGHRALTAGYTTDIFDAYPSDIKIEPHLAYLFNTHTTALAQAESEYLTISGSTIPMANENETWKRFMRRKLVHNLKFWLTAAPGGAGKTRTITLRENGGNQALTATATNLETSASDTTNKVEVAVDNYVDWISAVANAPAASHIQIYCEVEDLEDFA